MSWIITGTQRYQPAALLDQFPGAAAAYSLRNLVGTSNPAVVRVRRDNDNAEQDFTATEVSDGTLATWVGAGNDGFVRTWYDQSGANRHANQTALGNQPAVVTAGSLVLDNQKPAVSFNGTTAFLSMTSSVITAQPFSTYTVYKALVSPSTPFGQQGADATVGSTAGRRSNGQYIVYAGSALATGVHGSDQKIACGLFNGGYSQGFWNGVQLVSGNAGTNANIDRIGGNSNTEFHNGTIQEIIIYPTNNFVSRVAIEENLNGFYSAF